MRKGLSVLEITIAVATLAVMTASIFPVLGWMITKSKQTQFDAQASMVLTSGIEAAYNVFLTSDSWEEFGEGVYHPAISTEGEWWTLADGYDVVDARFERGIRVSLVCRRSDTGGRVDGALCGSGSAIDPNSRMITSTVKWKEKGQDKTIEAELLITRL